MFFKKRYLYTYCLGNIMEKIVIALIVATLVLAFFVINFIKKKNKLKKIEQKTAYLELQGYKRSLRKENALRFLDQDLLTSLEGQTYTKEEAKQLIVEASKQVKEGQFREERAKEDHKNRKTLWTGG